VLNLIPDPPLPARAKPSFCSQMHVDPELGMSGGEWAMPCLVPQEGDTWQWRAVLGLASPLLRGLDL
jgi:hypothetical protein